MASGRVEAYSFGEDAKHWPVSYSAVGSVDFQPAVIGNRVVWATQYGDINVLTTGKQGIQFRLRTNARLAGRITTAPPDRIFAVTENGYVYCFGVANGVILWQYSTAEPTSEPAIVVGDQLYLVTRYGGMHVVDAKTGMAQWWAPQIRQFVAATPKRVYGVDEGGKVAILDRQSGGLVGRIPTVVTDRLFVNSQTDRIYIASASGLVQCLHEIEADFPTIHVAVEKSAPEPAPEPVPGTKPAPKTEPIDPFRSGAPGPAPGPAKKTPTDAPAEKADDNPFG
jgi:hypothetical protein